MENSHGAAGARTCLPLCLSLPLPRELDPRVCPTQGPGRGETIPQRRRPRPEMAQGPLGAEGDEAVLSLRLEF